MFFENENSDEESFQEYENDEIIYEGILIQEREDSPPIAIESKDIHLNSLYINHIQSILK